MTYLLKKAQLVVAVFIISIGTAAPSFATIMDDPFAYFNVYSLGDIGADDHAYGSDFQGIAGAAGDVWFSGFSLDAIGVKGNVILYTGGSATLSNGSYLRGMEVGGDVYIGSLNIEGNIVSGGNVVATGGGTINGDVIATGTVDMVIGRYSTMSVFGEIVSSAEYETNADHAALSDFFLATSADIAAMASTGTVVNNDGKLTFTGDIGVNVITIDADELNSAWGFAINAPEDAVVYINVINASGGATLDSTNWTYNGGITAGDVLLNYSQTGTLSMSGGNNVNILAPLADTVFASGVLAGNLIVGNLEGGGQVNAGYFQDGGTSENTPVPEPATIFQLVAGLCAFSLCRRRMRSATR